MDTSVTTPGAKVTDEIARFLPWTIFAVGSGLLISFVLGIVLGMTMAYDRNSVLSPHPKTEAEVACIPLERGLELALHDS